MNAISWVKGVADKGTLSSKLTQTESKGKKQKVILRGV